MLYWFIELININGNNAAGIEDPMNKGIKRCTFPWILIDYLRKLRGKRGKSNATQQDSAVSYLQKRPRVSAIMIQRDEHITESQDECVVWTVYQA